MNGFEEVQRFRQKWLWALLLTPFLFGFADFYLEGSYGLGIIVLLIVFLGSIGTLYFSKLIVAVETDGIHIKLFPLHIKDRIIQFEDIKSFSAEDYRPMIEFGGWGARWRPGKIAYSISGSKGVRIKREDKKDVMIGSKKPEKLEEAIREMKKQ